MPSKSEPYTLEENLALTNKELAGNVGRLASLIRAYEAISWKDAQRAAGALMAGGTVAIIDYVESVRRAVKEGKSTPAERKEKPEKPEEVPAVPASKPVKKLTIYEKNYDRLMELAPGLEELLWNYKEGDHLVGRSESRGHRDWIIELLFENKREFHFALTHYKMVNGDLLPDPDMEILIDMKHCTVQALHYQDETHYSEVYDNKETRKMVDEKEQKNQNRFLEEWLKKLKKQGHRIEWEEESEPEENESEIIDLYGKQKRGEELEDKAEKTPENAPSKQAPPKGRSRNSKRKQETKIIQMGTTEKLTDQRLESLLMVVDFLEFGMLGSNNQLVERAREIIHKIGMENYLIDHFVQVIKENQDPLKTSCFFQLVFLSPRLLDFSTESDLELRLVSSKSDIAYSIQGGSSKAGDSLNIAIHQIDPKVEGEPVLMLNIDVKNHQLAVSLVSAGFAGFSPFDFSKENPLKEVINVVILRKLSRWLSSLLKYHYTVIEPNPKTVAESEVAESIVVPEETQAPAPEEHSAHYINEDIPDFEPGHVQLTEVHIKRGVTQAMIDKINQTQEGIVILPRKKMIKNTKSVDMDRENFAEKPGFRLSRTGKFYTETRSNRADRTSYGL